MKEEFVSARKGSTSITLLERARQNDSDAWAKLVELYAPLIYMRCRNQWGYSSSDALQIGQDVFLKVSNRLGNFDRKRTGSFRNWLRTIVDNHCKDELRKSQIAVASGGTNAKQMLEDLVDKTCQQDEPEPEMSEKTILMNQAAKMVEAQTSSRDWKIFWRVNVDNSHRKVVAEEFQVSDNVVYLACSRIKKRLKATFQDLLDEDLFTAMESSNS